MPGNKPDFQLDGRNYGYYNDQRDQRFVEPAAKPPGTQVERLAAGRRRQAKQTRRPGGWGVVRVSGRLGLALALLLGAYLLLYRPLQLRWGATDAEVGRAMPGDDIQPQPIFNATRAVTINAPPDQIWPWLLQIGYRRAGWYGYDSLEKPFG